MLFDKVVLAMVQGLQTGGCLNEKNKLFNQKKKGGLSYGTGKKK